MRLHEGEQICESGMFGESRGFAKRTRGGFQKRREFDMVRDRD